MSESSEDDYDEQNIEMENTDSINSELREFSFVNADIHELSDKNPDYFFCTLHYKTLNVRTVTRTYANLEDLQKNLVNGLN